MRSNASSVTRPDGCAAAQASGTSAWPARSAASMKWAIARLSPRKSERIASPSLAAGQGPAPLKSSHVVGRATNVLVSCMNPPIAMRMNGAL